MEPHGHVELTWQKNILTVQVYGPFNLEGIQIASNQIKESVKDKNFTQWHRIDFLDANTLGCPDVMKVIGRSYKWSNYLASCKHVAVCCSTPMQYAKMKHFIEHDNLDITLFSCVNQTQQFIDQINVS